MVCVGFGIAQNPNRIYQSHNEKDGVFSVTTNEGKYKFQFYTSDILETTFIPAGESYNKESHAVAITPSKVETFYSYNADTITYASNGLSVSITTSPFTVEYAYKDKVLISEKRGYYKSAHDPMELVKDNIIADVFITRRHQRSLGQDHQ